MYSSKKEPVIQLFLLLEPLPVERCRIVIVFASYEVNASTRTECKMLGKRPDSPEFSRS